MIYHFYFSMSTVLCVRNKTQRDTSTQKHHLRETCECYLVLVRTMWEWLRPTRRDRATRESHDRAIRQRDVLLAPRLRATSKCQDTNAFTLRFLKAVAVSIVRRNLTHQLQLYGAMPNNCNCRSAHSTAPCDGGSKSTGADTSSTLADILLERRLRRATPS